jgi:hypothetical protein
MAAPSEWIFEHLVIYSYRREKVWVPTLPPVHVSIIACALQCTSHANIRHRRKHGTMTSNDNAAARTMLAAARVKSESTLAKALSLRAVQSLAGRDL